MPFRISWIELSEGRLGDSLQHFLRENAEKLPPDVQGLLDGSVLVVTLRKKEKGIERTEHDGENRL